MALRRSYSAPIPDNRDKQSLPCACLCSMLVYQTYPSDLHEDPSRSNPSITLRSMRRCQLPGRLIQLPVTYSLDREFRTLFCRRMGKSMFGYSYTIIQWRLLAISLIDPTINDISLSSIVYKVSYESTYNIRIAVIVLFVNIWWPYYPVPKTDRAWSELVRIRQPERRPPRRSALTARHNDASIAYKLPGLTGTFAGKGY